MANIFISYNRQSVAIARNLADDIKSLGHTVWFDQELSGGQVWWDQILATVRDCDVFVFILDPEALNSTACKCEYGYAADLGKPILPVLVSGGVSTNLLPPALSQIQYIDYRKQDRDAAFRLARALTTVPPPKPLPDPLPTPPEAPISYLGSLREQVETISTLSYEEQSVLVVDLKRSLRDPGTCDDTRTLLERLRRRRDLFASIAEEIDELLGSRGKASTAPAPVSETEPSSREPSKVGKKPSVAEKPQSLVTKPASTLVSGKTTLRSRLVTSLCGAAIGFTFVAISVYISVARPPLGDWLLVALLWGFIPWAIAGAITDRNRRVIALALAVAAIGVIVGWVIAAIIDEREAFLIGPAIGAPGVILGAIIGVILERSRSKKSNKSVV